jgi:hypothetical protein
MDVQGTKSKGKMTSKRYRRSRYFQNMLHQGQRLIKGDQYAVSELLKECEQLNLEIDEYKDMLLQIEKNMEDVRTVHI